MDRLPENLGKPFALGEKFQGRDEVDAAHRSPEGDSEVGPANLKRPWFRARPAV